MGQMIPLGECKDRVVYELDSNNLVLGVFVAGVCGFIGIRKKFGTRSLSTEYHYEMGALGTAFPLREICVLPEDLVCKEFSGYVCDGRAVVERDGSFYYEDGEIANRQRVHLKMNQPLFDFLDQVEES